MPNIKCFAMNRCCLISVVLLLASSGPVFAQTAAKKAAGGPGNPEQRAARAYEAALANPADLRAFLARMPKGADLHYHLSGGIYAETFIRAAAEDGLCVNLAILSFTKPTAASQSAPTQPTCGDGKVPAAKAYSDQHLYDALIDAFSMRSFVPSAGVSGHDHFFDTFGKFGGTSRRHTGEYLDEIATRAASQNEQYLGLMETRDFSRTALIARQIGWHDDMNQLRADLLARGLRDDVAVTRAEIDEAESARRAREHCGQPQETSACRITIRYLYEVLRGF